MPPKRQSERERRLPEKFAPPPSSEEEEEEEEEEKSGRRKRMDLLVCKKKKPSVKKRQATGAASANNTRVKIDDCDIQVHLLGPTTKQRPKPSSSDRSLRVDGNDPLCSFVVHGPTTGIGLLRAAVVKEAMKLGQYKGHVGESSALYVKKRGVTYEVVPVPEDSTEKSLTLFDSYRQRKTGKVVELRLSFGKLKAGEVAYDTDTDEELDLGDYSQQVTDGTIALRSPAAKKDASNRAERAETQSNMSRLAGTRDWLKKAIGMVDCELHESLSPLMLTLAGTYLQGLPGEAVYSRYTFIQDDEDTWPPSIDTLIPIDVWEEEKTSKRLGGNKPGRGKYPLDLNGLPLPVEGEGRDAAGADKTAALTKGIEKLAEGNREGLMHIGDQLSNKTFVERVSLSRNGQHAIATLAKVRAVYTFLLTLPLPLSRPSHLYYYCRSCYCPG